MSRENVEVIRDLIAAINERDFERAIAHHTDDVVLEAPAGIRGGTFRGREAVSEWYADWFRIFDWNVHADIREIAEFGEDGVLLVSGLRGRGRHSGVEAAETFAWLYRLREGKVTRVEGFLLREEALEAAGLREWAMSAENVEVVRQAYDALNALLRGEIAEENAAQVAQRFFDPQFEQDWPLGQEWPDQPPHFRGIPEMMSFIEQVRSAWLDLAFEPLEFIEAPGDRVLTPVRQTGRGRESGIPIVIHFFQLFTIRDGRLSKAEFFRHRADALEAAGLEE